MLASELCDLPAFLPYAYFSLATTDWSDQELFAGLGLDRLEFSQFRKLAAGRAYLQSELAEMFAEGGSSSQPVRSQRDPSLCLKIVEGGYECQAFRTDWKTSEEYLLRYVAHADLVRWIKESREEMMLGNWHFCGPCQRGWSLKAEEKTREVLGGFSRFMGLTTAGEAEGEVVSGVDD